MERFNFRKLIGVLASLLGIILISSVDFSSDTDKTRGSFPHKSRGEIATGGILALLSAILYGAYIIIMKRDMGDESRVDMPLFFGFIGVINLPTLLPGFVVLHFTGIEPFELPPTSVIWYILAVSKTSLYQ